MNIANMQHDSAAVHNDEIKLARECAKEAVRTLRFVRDTEEWYGYDGRVWRSGATVLAERAVKAFLDQRSSQLLKSDKVQFSAGDYSHMRSMARVRAVMSMMRSEDVLSAKLADFDNNQDALPVANGVVDLRTGELTPFSSDILITKTSDVTFDASATCPEFDGFMRKFSGGDLEMEGFIDRVFGSCLKPQKRSRRFYILHGNGGNGKSTLIGLLQKCLGELALGAPQSLLLGRREGTHPTDLADVRGRRLVVIGEPNQAENLCEGTLKKLTGGDLIGARRMRENHVYFTPEATIMMQTNHLPIVKGVDDGIWDRIVIVPCMYRIPSEQQDTGFEDRLWANEQAGIFNRLLSGHLDYRSDPLSLLSLPGAVKKATEAFAFESDPVRCFVETCIAIEPEADGCVSKEDLYDSYLEFCNTKGIQKGSRRAFGSRLKNLGVREGRNSSTRFWRVRLQSFGEAEVRAYLN